MQRKKRLSGVRCDGDGDVSEELGQDPLKAGGGIVFRLSPLIGSVELRSDPVIVRVNAFDEESAALFTYMVSLAQSTGQPVIPVVIDSYGGDVYALLSMISAIRTSPVPVMTMVQGKAMSCGAILAALGSPGLRYVDQDAFIMLHDSAQAEMNGKVEEIRSMASQLEALNKKIYGLMAKACGKKEKYFLDLIHKASHSEIFMTPDEAVKHGIVDHVGYPTLKCSIDVKFDIVGG